MKFRTSAERSARTPGRGPAEIELCPDAGRSRRSALLAMLLIPMGGALSFGSAGRRPRSSGSIRPARRVPADAHRPFRRLLWVTRWDFRSADDVKRIFANASAAGFTDVYFQVRGEGTAFYKSAYEPWAGELSGRGPIDGIGVDPGWDPLATAVGLGRGAGLRVHAWINTMPGWNKPAPPPARSKQLAVTREHWFMIDARGRRRSPEGFYSFLDPGLPEVRRYLAGLVGQIVRDYPVDGVHLDYIRYPAPDEWGGEYIFHPRVELEFRRRFGKPTAILPQHAVAFRQDQISATIREIRVGMKRIRPAAELSATALSDPQKGMTHACQDTAEWLRDGLVDAVAPMVYVRGNEGLFRSRASHFLGGGRAPRTWVGIWPRRENPGWQNQVSLAANAGAGGISIYCYQEIFPGHRFNEISTQLRAAFAPAQRPSQTFRKAPVFHR